MISAPACCQVTRARMFFTDFFKEREMTTIMPNDELMRKAVSFIDELLRDTDTSLSAALEQAALRFNLGPAACEYLQTLFSDRATKH